MPISDLCDKQGVQPTVFYRWQKEFFENGAAAPEGPLDRTLTWMIENFYWDRFWPLFAFLFGIGFTILLTRAEEKGRSVVVIHLRRVAVLFGFAFLMAILCSGGQILARYAAVGLLLVPIRHLRTPVLLAIAAGLFLIAAARIPDLVRSRTIARYLTKNGELSNDDIATIIALRPTGATERARKSMDYIARTVSSALARSKRHRAG